jgi:hypothetical protein
MVDGPESAVRLDRPAQHLVMGGQLQPRRQLNAVTGIELVNAIVVLLTREAKHGIPKNTYNRLAPLYRRRGLAGMQVLWGNRARGDGDVEISEGKDRANHTYHQCSDTHHQKGTSRPVTTIDHAD